MEPWIAVCVGIALSAAVGFRVFVPLLGMGLAARAGLLTLAGDFQWLASPLAILAFTVATAVEIGAYYIPWLDNLLDTISTPAAVAAGVLVAASVMIEMSPFLRWTLAIIAGGGVAGAVQSGTTVARGASTMATAGLGNFAVATGEILGAAGTTALAIFLPVVGAVLGLLFFVSGLVVILKLRRWRTRERERAAS